MIRLQQLCLDFFKTFCCVVMPFFEFKGWKDAKSELKINQIYQYHVSNLKKDNVYSSYQFLWYIWDVCMRRLLWWPKGTLQYDRGMGALSRSLRKEATGDTFLVVTYGNGMHTLHRFDNETKNHIITAPDSSNKPSPLLNAAIVFNSTDVLLDVTTLMNTYRCLFHSRYTGNVLYLHEWICILYLNRHINASTLYKLLVVLPRTQLLCLDGETLREYVFKHNDPIKLS